MGMLRVLRHAVNKMLRRGDGSQIQRALSTWVYHVAEFKRLRMASRRVLLSRMLKVSRDMTAGVVNNVEVVFILNMVAR